MTSPINIPLAHRLLLAHLQAATSIATTFQNLPLFTPHPLPTDIQPTPAPIPHRRPTPPPPSHSLSRRSRSPPRTTGLPHKQCKPELSPSYTPTSTHHHSPPPSPAKPLTSPTTPHRTTTWPLSPHAPHPTYSLHSSSSTPPPPPPPLRLPLHPLPAPAPSPPYPDNGGWEPSDDEKLASLKLNKRARPSWKQIEKTLNKTPFDCKGRWQTLQILFAPQPPDGTTPNLQLLLQSTHPAPETPVR